jgi:hypothetical protein
MGISDMKKNSLNKKGKLLSIWWFMIWAIVGGGIVGLAAIFYGNPCDIRAVEANLLIDKISDCVSYGGRINENLISFESSNSFDLSNCYINFLNEEEEFFYKISFYKLDNLEQVVFQKSGGNLNLESFCEVRENLGAVPLCVEKKFYSLDKKNNQYIIKILVSIKKIEQNVK